VRFGGSIEDVDWIEVIGLEQCDTVKGGEGARGDWAGTKFCFGADTVQSALWREPEVTYPSGRAPPHSRTVH